MRSNNVVQELADKKTGVSKRVKIIIAIAAIIVIGACAFGGYRYSNASTFAKGVRIDGVDVSGLNLEDAIDKVTAENNSFTIAEDGHETKEVKTSFTYDIKASMRVKMGLASIDPRVIFCKNVNYDVTLKKKSGIEKSADAIGTAVPDAQGVKYTEDAYIDYKKAADYKFTKYKMDRKKIISEPKVTADSLKDEFEFAKQYLSKPIYLNNITGTPYEIEPNALAKIILYSKKGPKYSQTGAQEIAKEIADKYAGSSLKVKTLAGYKILGNHALKINVNVDKTAESILNTAKSGEAGSIVTDQGAASAGGSHIEINLSGQSVRYVKNGNVVFTSSMVSGGPGHRTRTGIFKINAKQRNATLKGRNDDGTDYESPVSYWMPFDGGNGLHDAPWRGAFGGGIYLSGGSHGCVNMPPAMAAQLYNMIPVGTIVYVYS